MSNNINNFQFASESVCAGHPDKLCDQISDAILDEALRQDASSRVAIETVATKNKLIVTGELTTSAKIDFEKIARSEIRRLGYTNPDWGFSDKSDIEVYISQQSPDISTGVDNDGAGDQGMMFGYACNETPELMPLPIVLAHALTKKIDEIRESKQLDYLRPDGKSQVVVKYQNNKPISVEHVTVAVPHNESTDLNKVFEDVYSQIVSPILKQYGYTVSKDKLVVNGTGVWHFPGPGADVGLTGRKIVVDGYGGYARVGGGAFSGKDPSKVDRSGAYAARYIAKNIVANKLATRVEVALAYFIGAKAPVLINIDTFGSATVDQAEIEKFAAKLLTPSVKEIIGKLDLRRPIYKQTAAYGHFGKPDLPWEQIVTV